MNAFLEPREPISLPTGWRRLKLILEWDGTNFAGWQVQAKGERTVQGVLEKAFEPLGMCSRPVAAGRTDAGVHALGGDRGRPAADCGVRVEVLVLRV